MRNQGKPIFDPFADSAYSKAEEERERENRHSYNVWRACGHCHGSGKGGSTLRCAMCAGRKGQHVTVMAQEMTEPELQALAPWDRSRAETQIQAFTMRNREARVSSLAGDRPKPVVIARGNLE